MQCNISKKKLFIFLRNSTTTCLFTKWIMNRIGIPKVLKSIIQFLFTFKKKICLQTFVVVVVLFWQSYIIIYILRGTVGCLMSMIISNPILKIDLYHGRNIEIEILFKYIPNRWILYFLLFIEKFYFLLI